MSKGEPMSGRSERFSANRRDASKGRRCQSQLSAGEHERSASKNGFLPTVSAYCAHCKLPLLIDVAAHDTNLKSRASSTRGSNRLCPDCIDDQGKGQRTPSSRLHKSASFDWTDVGDKIETWFEKAKTPDQRVVYNFLEKINKEDTVEVESAHGKSLDDILASLKKYRTRFNGNRRPNIFTGGGFESKSWRVMRNAPAGPGQFSRFNPAFGDDASRDFRIGTVFATTEPRIGSTFLLHPGWV